MSVSNVLDADDSFDGLYRKALAKVGLKRLPIILIPVALPIFLLIFVIWIIICLCLLFTIGVSMVLGFWQCSFCKKIYWSNTDRTRKRYLEDNSVFKAWECEHCKLADTLAKKD